MRQVRTRRVPNCIFCRNKADSREHAWADWVLKRFFRKGVIYAVVGRDNVTDPTQKAIRVKCVCRQCNTGWMKQLEDAVIPSTGLLMQDFSLWLDEDHQKTIAAWAMKIAMVFEHITPANRTLFFAQQQRETFRTELHLPLHSFVWLGRYSGLDDLATYGTDVWADVNRDVAGVQGYVMTLAYRYLAVQVLTIRTNRPDHITPIIHANPGPWNRAAVRVWPVRGTVTWPPPLTLDGPEVSFEAFVRRWSLGDTAPDSLAGY